MHQNAYDVLAIDGSREMIAEAKRCHPELADRLEVMKIPEQFQFESSSFDGIVWLTCVCELECDEV